MPNSYGMYGVEVTVSHSRVDDLETQVRSLNVVVEELLHRVRSLEEEQSAQSDDVSHISSFLVL